MAIHATTVSSAADRPPDGPPPGPVSGRGLRAQGWGVKALVHRDTEVWEDPYTNLRVIGIYTVLTPDGSASTRSA